MDFEIKPITDVEQLKKLDFTEDGTTNPLGVNEFVQSKASLYHKNKITTIWGVTFQGVPSKFFCNFHVFHTDKKIRNN